MLATIEDLKEVEGIVNLLALPERSEILDLCCGHGRHAIALAQRGYRVTGQDLSEFLLARGRAEADAKTVELDWILSDMRRIPFEQRFDAVINIFSSFGYLETEDEDQRVLDQIHRDLKLVRDFPGVAGPVWFRLRRVRRMPDVYVLGVGLTRPPADRGKRGHGDDGLP
jgi:SAM-dependent methyltransferase